MTITRVLVPAGVALLVGAAPGVGQPTAETPTEEPSMTCWRGEPLPACLGFFIVEAQASLPLWSETRPIMLADGRTVRAESFDSQLDWNLGYMVNVSPDWAVGGVVTLGTGSSDPLTGLRVRARRWLRSELSVEVEAGGFLTNQIGCHASDPLWGATADTRLNIGDRGSFFVRWDGLDSPGCRGRFGEVEPGGFEQVVYTGVGAGSTWAVVTTGIGFAVLVAIFASVYS